MKRKVDLKSSIRNMPHFPTVLVGVGNSQNTNIITVSLVHIFSIDPPYIGIGIAPSRYSFSLLKEVPEFTINVPGSDLLEEVVGCGSESGRDVEKFSKYDLTPQRSSKVAPSGIEECPLTLECKVERDFEIGDHVWFIGKVVSSTSVDSFDRSNLILYWGGEFRRPGTILRKR